MLNIAEVLVGAGEQERVRLEALISACIVHDVDESITRQAAFFRSKTKKVATVYLLDCCIAATALSMSATVVTNNTKDFVFAGVPTKSF